MSDQTDQPFPGPILLDIGGENRLAGSRMWRVGAQDTRGIDEKTPEICGYASATSTEPGASIDFHVCLAQPGAFGISIYRIGSYGGLGARHVFDGPPLTGTPQPATAFDDAIGRVECGWDVSYRLDVPSAWTSGLYVAAFTTDSGFRALAPFVVRGGATAPLAVVLPFLTYQAANRWPLDTVHGSSLAYGYHPESGGATYKCRAFEVSFDRPYTRTGLPGSAHLDIEVIGWLEDQGHDLVYVADTDIHSGAVDPSAFAGLVFVGQHEYWTRAQRDAVSRASAAGTGLAFLGAGTSHWHARLEPSADGRADRVIACYKSDPDPKAEGTDTTTRWRAVRPGPGMPEQTLTGTQLRGTTAADTDLVVANPGHWVWAGTGVAAGDAIRGLVKGQVDEVDRGAGTPPTGRGTVLAESPFVLLGKNIPAVQNTTVTELANGAVIFSAGTESWSLGLVRDSHLDPRVQAATRNILDRIASGPAEHDRTAPARVDRLRPDRTAGERARPTSPITVENLRPGSREWRIGAGGTTAPDDRALQIAGYASATSVALGAPIDFHVTVNPSGPFTIEIYRMGYYRGLGARRMLGGPALDGVTRAAPRTDPATREVTCDWPVSWTLDVPGDWTSGLYYAVFTAGTGARSFAPFVVRDPSQRDNLCVVLPFTTYQAYNQWPLDGVAGRSLYKGYVPGARGTRFDQRSYSVSFDRPYVRQGQPNRIEYDLAFIRWAEEANFDLTYATGIDLHAGRLDPDAYAGLIFPGHDEYWSEQMRAHATAALDHGTSLAFLEANNIYWHVRVADARDGRPNRSVVCYKDTTDPAPGPLGLTTRWRNPRPAPYLPEQLLLGIQYNGIVARPTPLVVQEPEHWFWAGTDVVKDELIEDIVGGEADGHDPRFGAPAGAVMLAHSPYPTSSGGTEIHNTSVYETDEGALVFCSGSNDWPGALGLDGHTDRRIQRATANLLDRIQEPRLAARMPQIAHLASEETGDAGAAGPLRDVWRKARRLLSRGPAGDRSTTVEG